MITYSGDDQFRLIDAKADSLLTKKTVFDRLADEMDRTMPPLTIEQQATLKSTPSEPGESPFQDSP